LEQKCVQSIVYLEVAKKKFEYLVAMWQGRKSLA